MTFTVFVSSALVQVAIPVKQAVRVEIRVKMLALAAVYCFHSSFILFVLKIKIILNIE